MQVKELVEQIISYSHDEDSPETNLMSKALTWLNSAYHELLQENLTYLKNKMLNCETLDLKNGICELPNDFYILDKIILNDKNYGTKITSLDKDKYSIELNKLYIHNFKNINQIKLFYIPEFQQLKLDDSINNMFISPNQVDSLIWGALVWSGIYERALHTQSELLLFENKWTQAKQNFKMSLNSYSSDILRTKPYVYIN